MKFYCLIVDEAQKQTRSYRYLEQACRDRNLEFVPLVAATFDYSQDMQSVLDPSSIFFRMGIGKRTMLLEALLVREDSATFYSDVRFLFMRGTWGPTIVQQNAGLPVIPTIFNIDRSQEDQFEKYVKSLGGFPVVLKASGGSHGGSVLRVDSLESLRSVVGYVTAADKGSFALRKYISDATHLRFVVVGNEVDAIHYLPQPGDFRTNAVTTPQVETFARTDKNAFLFDLAIQTVMAEGLEFGGVDVLLDAAGDPYIAELNFPCNFSRNQMTTSVDIAGQMVDHLKAKANSVATA